MVVCNIGAEDEVPVVGMYSNLNNPSLLYPFVKPLTQPWGQLCNGVAVDTNVANIICQQNGFLNGTVSSGGTPVFDDMPFYALSMDGNGNPTFTLDGSCTDEAHITCVTPNQCKPRESFLLMNISLTRIGKKHGDVSIYLHFLICLF